MQIVNWNVGRPSKAKCKQILEKLLEINADIVVLTETNNLITLPEPYNRIVSIPLPQHHDGINYAKGECRTQLFTKYPIHKQYKTYDDYTAVCADVTTPTGVLTVYATIIGVFGGKGQRFKDDLSSFIDDIKQNFLSESLCLIGDFNTSFSGYAYPSKSAIEEFKTLFATMGLINTTAEIEDNIDHIVCSRKFLSNSGTTVQTWNHDKKLSDHIGVAIEIGF